MKPSQRIYQQRDIAKNQMDKYASFLAERMLVVPSGDRQAVTREKLIESHKESYRKWRGIYNVLTTEGAIASAQEQQERKKKKKQHEENKAKEVVEEVTKEPQHNKSLVNPFSDYVQKQLDTYFTNTTNTVMLNTSFPTTTSQTWTFTIPRFREKNEDAVIKILEEEVEGIV